MKKKDISIIKSAYIHIPFCKNICSYCDFCKNYYNEKIVCKYLCSLKKEIIKKYKKDKLNTLYIGGGSPSALSLKLLKKLFEITNIFILNTNYEFTFECNYEDINEEFLSLLKNNKVNRISIGIQTFNNKFESYLERKIDKKEMIEKINLCKKYFDNINIDLMYGLKNETIYDLKKDLELLKKIDVSHISTYCLILEEHTKLYLNKADNYDNSNIQTKMYYRIIKELKKAGYIHYEISNFSKKGYNSKHNLVYWNNENYYGFGAGASGFINNFRYDNTKSVFNYINGKTISYKENVNKTQMIKDEIMLNLRKTNGINKKMFYNKYKINIEKMFDYKYLVDNKLLVEDNNNLYIPEDKLFVSNEIIIKMLDNLKYI